MTAEQMWREFAEANHISGGDYEAWAFGDDADRLARLVLEGVKTATASAHPLYALEGEPLPEAGEYSVILNSREEAVCVIRTARVSIVPFQDVGAEHAFREGEGDRSLAFWRAVHERFFTQELAQAGLTFQPELPVVCEEFERVWPL